MKNIIFKTLSGKTYKLSKEEADQAVKEIENDEDNKSKKKVEEEKKSEETKPKIKEHRQIIVSSRDFGGDDEVEFWVRKFSEIKNDLRNGRYDDNTKELELVLISVYGGCTFMMSFLLNSFLDIKKLCNERGIDLKIKIMGCMASAGAFITYLLYTSDLFENIIDIRDMATLIYHRSYSGYTDYYARITNLTNEPTEALPEYRFNNYILPFIKSGMGLLLAIFIITYITDEKRLFKSDRAKHFFYHGQDFTYSTGHLINIKNKLSDKDKEINEKIFKLILTGDDNLLYSESLTILKELLTKEELLKINEYFKKYTLKGFSEFESFEELVLIPEHLTK